MANDNLSVDILARLLNNIDQFVDFRENKISFSTIGTDSVSSCTCILVIGNLKNRSFAYLSHYPECFEPPEDTTISTLVYFIEQISGNIERAIKKEQPPSDNREFQVDDLNNLQVLMGGHTEEERDLIREAFTLLNQPDCNIEDLFHKPSSKHVYQQLKCKGTILSPTTLLLSDDEEDEDGMDI
jgi:hypothetical protein